MSTITPADYHLQIQTEIRVADLLALYNKGETRWFLCHNVALMIRPQLEAITKDFFVDDGVTVSTGYREYCMIDDGFRPYHFENLLMHQFSAWTEKYYNTKVHDHTDISGLGFAEGFETARSFRRNLLEMVLADDRDAVLKVEC